jgi:putative membrane protein
MRSIFTAALALIAAGPAVLPAATVHAQAHGPDDATIVAIFDAANTADMETGALAEQRGSSPEVRDFGAMLVRDHRIVRQQGRDLATKLGVTPTAPKDDQSAKDHAAAMTRLRSLEGDEFDRAFLQHEAAFHQAVIDAVQGTLLPAIDNVELRALVVKVAPAFEAHMKMARELEKKVASPTAGDQASSR